MKQVSGGDAAGGADPAAPSARGERLQPAGGPGLVDRLLAVYALLSATALAFPNRPPAWPLVLGLHLVAAAALLRAGPFGRWLAVIARRWPRLADFVGHWYPLLLIPALYGELPLLNVSVHAGAFFDPLILRIEEAIFGSQPSRAWAEAAPMRWLSEILHAAYLSYYFIIYIPPLVLWLQGRRAAFRRMVLGVMLTFVAHYLFFIFFPVQGPRYIFPAPTAGSIEEGAVYRLTHVILEAGSSQGAAFPSSHVGVAVAQAIACIHLLPGLAPVVGLLALGLALGAIYGGFHYATDAVVGAALGAALALVAARAGRSAEPAGDRRG